MVPVIVFASVLAGVAAVGWGLWAFERRYARELELHCADQVVERQRLEAEAIELRDQLLRAVAAVRWVLHRVKNDPDAAYVVGYGTEAFERMIVALSHVEKRPLETLRTEYAQGDHHGAQPRILALQARVRELEDALRGMGKM